MDGNVYYPGILITGQSFYLQKFSKPHFQKNKTSKTLLLFSPNRLDWPDRDSTKTATILDEYMRNAKNPGMLHAL